MSDWHESPLRRAPSQPRAPELGHDARLARYVSSYSKGQKNDFRGAEAIADAVQPPTMKFVAWVVLIKPEKLGTSRAQFLDWR